MASDDFDGKTDSHENDSSDTNGTSIIIDDDDPVVQEIPIYLAKGLANNLYLLQYPLRPAHIPYDGKSVLETRMKGDQLEMTVGLETRGPSGQHYSQSKGMQYSAGLSGGVMDRIVLSSQSSKSGDMSRYVAGVFKDNQIHLTPLKDIVQLRPCLRHIEKLNESGRVPGAGGVGAVSDGETTATESEEEEVKPVTVRFAKAGAKDRQKAEPEEPWKVLSYHSLESNEATIERELLFAGDDSHTEEFSVMPGEYLDMVCPVETMQKSASPLGPSDVLSLTTLKTLPYEKQVIELMKKAVILSFDYVCMLLSRSKGERGSVLEYLQKCSLLVQGCWVVHSALLLTKESSSLRNARDYILWCFTQQHTITRKDLAATLKITTQQLRDILKPIACQRPEGGWQFRMETDHDFISKYPQVVSSQESLWQRRHTELVQVYGLGTSPAAPLSSSASEGKSASGSRTKSSQPSEAKIDFTPARTRLLQPNQLDVDRTGSNANSLKDFCRTAIGRTVVSLSELRDRLLRHQSSLAKDNPMRGQVVTNDLLVSTLKDIGCVELGQAHFKRLFVIPNIGDHTDLYRSAIIDLLKNSKSLKRKQVIDAISSQNVTCDNKVLTSALRDLCNSRGAQWYLKGTI